MEEKYNRMVSAVKQAKSGMDKVKKLLRAEVAKREETVKAKDAEILSLREVALLEAQLMAAASEGTSQNMMVQGEDESGSSTEEEEEEEEAVKKNLLRGVSLWGMNTRRWSLKRRKRTRRMHTVQSRGTWQSRAMALPRQQRP